ncbi:MAG: protease modulator HflC [Bdellovibrionales bacterium]
MKANKFVIIVFVGILGGLSILSSAFMIHEGRQAVITQFGKPLRVVKDPGLHFKVPFIQDVRKIDLRILSWDGFPNQIPTKDKKYIEVDTTARWKITDPLKFIQTVQDEGGARSRLDAILDGITRDVISGSNLVEAVRNSNDIFAVIESKKKAATEAANKIRKDTGESDEEARVRNRLSIEEPDEISGEIERVGIGREELSRLIVEKARTELEPLGVDLIDVQLKRISYEASVEKKVYDRMISERQRVAEKIRSYGKGEQAKIEGKTKKNLQSIQSQAYRKVQNIKGSAEAEAFKVYAEALGRDPSFFRFIRTLEAYEKALPAESRLILSSQSKFWQVLKEGQ